VVVFANLKEKALVGFPSHGMVMCVSNQDKSIVKVLDPPKDSKCGDIVMVEGVDGSNWESGAKKLLKVMDQTKELLRTDKNGVAVFDGKQIKINGKNMKNEVKDG